MRLGEPPGDDPGAQDGATGVGDPIEPGAHGGDVPETRVGVGASAGEKTQEVGFARPVRAEHGDAIAEPHLEVERLHEPRQLEPLRHHRALARARSAEAQLQILLGRALLGGPACSNFDRRVTAAW